MPLSVKLDNCCRKVSTTWLEQVNIFGITVAAPRVPTLESQHPPFIFFFESCRCGRPNSSPASSVMDCIFCCSDSSRVSVDTVIPSLFWYSPSSISSICLPPYSWTRLFTCQTQFSSAFLHLSVIFSACSNSLMSCFLTWYLRVRPHAHLYIFIFFISSFFTWELVIGIVSTLYC